MRADVSVLGGSGWVGKDVTQSAALVVLSILGVALALILEACCGY